MSILAIDTISGRTSGGSTNANTLSKQIANAWVIFDGTGAVTVKDSFNVSGVIDNLTGDYTISFETPFDTSDYLLTTSNVLDTGANSDRSFGVRGTSNTNGSNDMSTSNVRMIVQAGTGTRFDQDVLCVAVFGGMN